MSDAVKQLKLFRDSESDSANKSTEAKHEDGDSWLMARRPRAIETIQQWFLSAGNANSAKEWKVPGIEVTEAVSAAQDLEAWQLVAQRYAERGYGVPDRNRVNPNEFTLIARRDGRLVGTLTVNPGQQGRLGADAVFGVELKRVRQEGRRICELTRLAVVEDVGSAPTLAALFGRAYAIARQRFLVSDFVIEVNPRHTAFYRRALGFVAAADERVCPRVGAPAVLMRLDLDAVRRRLEVGAIARGTHATALGAESPTGLELVAA